VCDTFTYDFELQRLQTLNKKEGFSLPGFNNGLYFQCRKMNGELDPVAKKKQLITRNLQETLGEDRLDVLLKERDLKVLSDGFYNVDVMWVNVLFNCI